MKKQNKKRSFKNSNVNLMLLKVEIMTFLLHQIRIQITLIGLERKLKIVFLFEMYITFILNYVNRRY